MMSSRNEAVVGLEVERVRHWLQRMHPTDICGIAGEPDCCPLAVYLAEANGLKRSDEEPVVLVGGTRYHIYVGNSDEVMSRFLPDWADRFVQRIDKLWYSSRPGEAKITAHLALDLLDRALAYPNFEDLRDDESC